MAPMPAITATFQSQPSGPNGYPLGAGGCSCARQIVQPVHASPTANGSRQASASAAVWVRSGTGATPDPALSVRASRVMPAIATSPRTPSPAAGAIVSR